MIDLHDLRERPEAYQEACDKKRVKFDVKAFLELDGEYRKVRSDVESMRAAQNVVSKEIPKLSGDEKAAKLAEMKLTPAPRADKRTLIRRATFDLTGLPPTPADVDAFLEDTSPEAFAQVIERLLASSAYGERWGRHWLDVARYADSNGLDENVAHGNAWRYRDYVVNSFNADKPYDRFVREQVAGVHVSSCAGPRSGRPMSPCASRSPRRP